MISKFIRAGAVVIPLAVLGFSGAAMADWNTSYYIPVQKVPSDHPAMVHRAGMSCGAAREMIQSDGYRSVVARDCRGAVYRFDATRHGHRVVLRFNPRNGRLARV